MKPIFWLERLTVGGILFLVLRNGIARYEVFFDEHRATPRALRFAAIVAKILPVRFYPASLCLNQKDEKGLALEYYRADNHCAVVDRFCENQMSGDPVALIQLSQQQAAGIRGYPATLKVGDDFLGENTFKAELFMAECFHRVSSLGS